MPCISLDNLYWDPKWVEIDIGTFQARVKKATDQDPRGWVVDGNYFKKLGSMLEDQTTDIICELLNQMFVVLHDIGSL